MARLTLLDLAERNGDAVLGLIEEVLTIAPELKVFPIVTKKGTTYRISKRTGLPTVGFRAANEGVVPSKSTYKSEARPMYFFDAQLEVDEAIVKADEGKLGSVLADESSGVMQAMGIAMGRQIFDGTEADEKGFLSLDQQMASGANYTYNATGSGTIGTAYLVQLNERTGASLAVGNEGEMSLGEWIKQQVIDSRDATKKLMAWVNNMSFYCGLQVHTDDAVFRVKNINAAHPLTDAIGEEVKSRVPLVRQPGMVWFMNRATRFLLQNSRNTVAGLVGIVYPAEPTSLAGFPIITTDSIVDGPAY